jgi:hypothetical protein
MKLGITTRPSIRLQMHMRLHLSPADRLGAGWSNETFRSGHESAELGGCAFSRAPASIRLEEGAGLPGR